MIIAKLRFRVERNANHERKGFPVLANQKMKPNYYGRWAAARKRYAAIISHIQSGGRVSIASYTKPRILSDVRWFKCGRDGVYLARGKNWDFLIPEAIRLVD